MALLKKIFENKAKDRASDGSVNTSLAANDSRIKVYARVRPVISPSDSYRFLPEAQPPAIEVKNPIRPETRRAEFTQILDGVDQLAVFKTVCLPLLNHFVLQQEANILLTSGITSSGKSYTMKGNPDNPGMIPLALVLLFNSLEARLATAIGFLPSGFNDILRIEDKKEGHAMAEKLKRTSQDMVFKLTSTLADLKTSMSDLVEQLKKDIVTKDSPRVEYSIWISFYEIYNDTILDLLKPNSGVQNNTNSGLKIAHENSNAYVECLTYLPVSSADEAYGHFLGGQARSHTGSTGLNATSSRSHSFFKIRLVRHDRQAERIVTSVFAFADLAGNERVKKTHNVGSRQDESNKINQSLMTLNRCIKQIRQKGKHIPFRETKLTHLLQPFLSGSGRVSIIHNLNPSHELLEESYFSLDMCADVQTIRQSYSLINNRTGSISSTNAIAGRREMAFKRSRPTSTPDIVTPNTPSKRSRLVEKQRPPQSLTPVEETTDSVNLVKFTKEVRRKYRLLKKEKKELDELEDKLKHGEEYENLLKTLQDEYDMILEQAQQEDLANKALLDNLETKLFNIQEEICEQERLIEQLENESQLISNPPTFNISSDSVNYSKSKAKNISLQV